MAGTGYQWDCAGSQLIPPANAPSRQDLPPDGTPATGTTLAGAHGPADATPSRTGSSILAAPAASNSGRRSGVPSYVLVALAVASGLLIVLVVRRQMGRRYRA